MVDVETAGPISGNTASLLSIGACDAYNQEQVFSCRLQNRSAKTLLESVEIVELILEKLTGG